MTKYRIKKYFSTIALCGALAVPALPVEAAGLPDHIMPESSTIYFQRADQLIFVPNLLQTPVNRNLSRSLFSPPNFYKVSLVIPDHNKHFSFSYTRARTKRISEFYGNSFLAPGNNFFLPRNSQRLEFNGEYQLGQFYVSSEFTWDLAETDQPDKNSAEGITFKFDAGQTSENLQTGFMYYYASSNDGTFNLLNPQQSPAYILNNSYGLMQTDSSETADRIKKDGIHAIILHSDLALSNRFNLHGGLAYGMSATDSKNNYGMEVDVGASYTIFDNLIYEVRFGYLNYGNIQQYNNSNDPEDMYLLTHHLTLEF